MQSFDETVSLLLRTSRQGCIPVSVVIPTRNEERHLARCLQAARRCSEIYVIDSQSTDATVEIARAFDAKGRSISLPGGLAEKETVGPRHFAVLERMDSVARWG